MELIAEYLNRWHYEGIRKDKYNNSFTQQDNWSILPYQSEMIKIFQERNQRKKKQTNTLRRDPINEKQAHSIIEISVADISMIEWNNKVNSSRRD